MGDQSTTRPNSMTTTKTNRSNNHSDNGNNSTTEVSPRPSDTTSSTPSLSTASPASGVNVHPLVAKRLAARLAAKQGSIIPPPVTITTIAATAPATTTTTLTATTVPAAPPVPPTGVDPFNSTSTSTSTSTVPSTARGGHGATRMVVLSPPVDVTNPTSLPAFLHALRRTMVRRASVAMVTVPATALNPQMRAQCVHAASACLLFGPLVEDGEVVTRARKGLVRRPAGLAWVLKAPSPGFVSPPPPREDALVVLQGKGGLALAPMEDVLEPLEGS